MVHLNTALTPHTLNLFDELPEEWLAQLFSLPEGRSLVVQSCLKLLAKLLRKLVSLCTTPTCEAMRVPKL